MIANMAQTQNFPQHRKNIGILHGGSFHNSSPAPQPNSSIGSFVNSPGGPRDSRNSEVQGLGRSSLQWQSPAASSDVHVANRWQNNSNESSAHAGQPVDTIFSAYSELFDNSACTSKDGQQHLLDARASYSASLASALPGGSPGLGRNVSGNGISSPLGGSLVSGSRRLGQGWNSSMDHGNLSLTVDPSKGGFALQGVGHPPSQPLSRFSTNPGFAERAAMFSPFGNGQFSPSFPLAENGSGRRSPAFENENKRVNGSVITSRSELASSPCPTEAPARNSVPHSNAQEVRGAERTREDGNGNGRGEVAVPASIRVPARLGGSQVEQEDGNVGHDADASSDSEASDFSRGQEASCADETRVDLVRTASVKKRKSSFVEEPVKDAPSPVSKEQKTKRCKDSEGTGEKDEQKPKAEWSGSENSGLSNSPAVKDCSKTAEQPKLDYIHVRARRGQATDSHSLAERVRREKISERMKFLQDLVPGCSKVTGKAVMLDEIINYVQSMQRQVASLSMKLAAVTPPADFNIDSVLSKQLQIGHGYGLPSMVEHPESSLTYPHVQSQTLQQLQHGGIPVPEFQPASDVNLRILNGSAPQLPRTQLEAFDGGLSQATSLWDGDLQSIVRMGYGQHMQGFTSGGLQCDLPPGHMKMEP